MSLTSAFDTSYRNIDFSAEVKTGRVVSGRAALMSLAIVVKLWLNLSAISSAVGSDCLCKHDARAGTV